MSNFETYHTELTKAMEWLGQQRDTLFLGQAVRFKGTGMSETLVGVPRGKKIELPVMEDAQMGMCTGLALGGFMPVSIYPRWNFLLLAASQLVLHLDKLSLYSHGRYRPKVIIRTAVATPEPLNPQHQHLGDYTSAFRAMLKTVHVIELFKPFSIVDAYQYAYSRTDGRSTLLVEHSSLYYA